VPIGFWLATRVPNPWGSPLYEALELVAMIPEHFLLFGFIMALMLPERRLPPVASSSIDARAAFAVVVAAALFQLAHLGGRPSLEIMAATPVGLMFAYLTLRTRSIWPAVGVHWALNLLPMAWQSLGAGST